MDEIELVVKMPKEEYEMIVNSEDCGLHTLTRAIARGTILPKGHGRIGDLTKLYNKIDKRNRENGKGKYTGILVLVDNAETIIEADKGDE